MTRQNRMDRNQFFQLLSGRSEADLKKALWELYWRGKAEFRERIEDLLAPTAPSESRKKGSALMGDGVLRDIKAFVGLVRSGAYMGGTREVSRQERSKWRITFRSHMENATGLLKQGDLEAGAPAVALLVDLLCEMHDYEYVHSQDPVQATGIVVSDRVEFLWYTLLEKAGFQEFVATAPSQLIRWEQPWGWTRLGSSRLCEKERSLADVLSSILKGPDAWLRFTECYLAALDRLPRTSKEGSSSWLSGWEYQCGNRSRALETWHERLHDYFRQGEAGDMLMRIASHPALAGPESDCFLARLCHEDGQTDRAKSLMVKCLQKLPGQREFQEFAKQIGIPLPGRA